MVDRRTAWMRWAMVLSLVLAACATTILAGPGLGGDAAALAETVTFRQGENGYTGCVDTRISEENPNANFSEGELVLGMKGRVGTLLRFDVSSIPSNATIQEAELGIFVSNYGERTTPITVRAYTVLRGWEEMEATWIKATSAQNWAAPGCSAAGTDRHEPALDEETIFERDQWYRWLITDAVQGWVSNPAANQGVLLRQSNLDVGGEYDIRQSEYPGLEVRPYLKVTYVLGPPPPTDPQPGPLPCEGTPEPGAILAVLQQGVGYWGAEDTTFNFDDRDVLAANEWFVRVGYRKHYSGLVKFDIGSIPQGSRIICAALSMFAERWSGDPLDVGAFAVKRPNSVPQANWNMATSSAFWQLGGCNGADDREQGAEDVLTVRTIYRWYHWDLTNLVAAWVNGERVNNGVSLQAIGDWDPDTVWFTASDDQTIANRPKLVILYVPPNGPAAATRTPTPTPTPTLSPGETQQVTFQQDMVGFAGTADVRISSEAPSANFGSAELKVGARQGIASLVRFDLTAIPSTAVVSSATLSLYAYARESVSASDLSVHRALQAWHENQATWLNADNATLWQSAGCAGTADRVASASDTEMVHEVGWVSWSVLGDVQSMVSDSTANHGWLLRQQDALAGVWSFYAAEGANIELHPRLVVTYSVP